MKSSASKIQLTGFDDLFQAGGTSEVSGETVQEVPLSELFPFKNHPFQVRDDEAMQKTVESIARSGVLSPAIVRPRQEGGYEIIAGHRRKRGSELAGKTTMPVLIRTLDDDEATIIMVDSNLQREKILPSEKAFAYKMKLDAMKRQAGRPSKENGATVLPHFSGKKSRQILAEQSGESHEQIRKYIRLTNLVPELLDMVDNTVLKEKGTLQMALRPAVELSYLPQNEQTALLEIMESEDCTPSHAQAIKIRDFSEKGKLNPDVILSIMQEEKPNQVEQFKMPRNRIDKFFPAGTPAQKIEDTIVKALEMYRRRERARER